MKTQNILNVYVLNAETKKKTLPIMYWLLKMRQNSTGARFTIASKICFTKQISKFFSNDFEPAHCQI